MFDYDTKGVLFGVGTREAFGQKAENISSVGSAGRMRDGSAENNSRVMLARAASNTFLAGHDLTRPMRFSSPLEPTRPSP